MPNMVVKVSINPRKKENKNKNKPSSSATYLFFWNFPNIVKANGACKMDMSATR